MNRLTRFGIAAMLAVVSASALSQGAPPDPKKTAIETRQALFKLISSQMGPIGGPLRTHAPFDAALVAKNAARIKALADMAPDLFALDTRGSDVKTAALDGIWNSQADFKTKADALATAADALATAAKSGDQAAIAKAAPDVGKACGSCHDAFRAKP